MVTTIKTVFDCIFMSFTFFRYSCGILFVGYWLDAKLQTWTFNLSWFTAWSDIVFELKVRYQKMFLRLLLEEITVLLRHQYFNFIFYPFLRIQIRQLFYFCRYITRHFCNCPCIHILCKNKAFYQMKNPIVNKYYETYT